MERLYIRNGEIYVHGTKTDDPTVIGKALLADIRRSEKEVRDIFEDYRKLNGLITLREECNRVWDLHARMYNNHKELTCLPIEMSVEDMNSIGSYSFVVPSIFSRILLAIKNKYLIVNPNYKKP